MANTYCIIRYDNFLKLIAITKSPIFDYFQRLWKCKTFKINTLCKC